MRSNPLPHATFKLHLVITRREFAAGLAATTLTAKPGSPQIAITMDDFNWKVIPGGQPDKANSAILGALARHNNLRGALFVIGKNVDRDSKKLLEAWCDAGHIIGNHTFSHPVFTTVSAEAFEENIQHAEDVLRGLPTYRKLFRFPALKEGDTREKRDAVRAWLAAHGYRMGYVTIDASDWYYDQRLRERLKADPSFDTRRYHDVYLEHMWQCATYYDQLARDVVGRTVPHTVLIHYNLLNVLFLDDLLDMFASKGWQFVAAETAFEDPVFRRQPDIVPAGESIIWALAKASGKFESRLRYPGEDGAYEKAKLDKLGL